MTSDAQSSTIESRKVWTTLITNTKYLSGLLTLDFSLKKVNSKYPLVALYTDTFSEEGHKALDDRNIPKIHVEYLLPTSHKDYSNDTRFYDCWSKLQPFSLTQFDRVVQLDSDMVVIQNMDELMDLPLNQEDRVFAASHACVCNPYNKPHYPSDWIAENCPFTHYRKYIDQIESQYSDDEKHIYGPPHNAGLGICNGGLQVVNPSNWAYQKISDALQDPSKTDDYAFSDQSLLSDVFKDSWVGLSYKYNALKTLKTIHADIWDDNEVKNIHYILNPKPWDGKDFEDETGTFHYWWSINDERLEAEKQNEKITDSF